MANTKEEFYTESGDMRLPTGAERARILGPFEDTGNHIMSGRCPDGEYYAEILSIQTGGWNSDTWDEMATELEEQGFDTYIRRSSGSTRTPSGTAKSATTSLYFW